jgi:hypothetical protein
MGASPQTPLLAALALRSERHKHQLTRKRTSQATSAAQPRTPSP